jgi:hypothetical protein
MQQTAPLRPVEGQHPAGIRGRAAKQPSGLLRLLLLLLLCRSSKKPSRLLWLLLLLCRSSK